MLDDTGPGQSDKGDSQDTAFLAAQCSTFMQTIYIQMLYNLHRTQPINIF